MANLDAARVNDFIRFYNGTVSEIFALFRAKSISLFLVTEELWDHDDPMSDDVVRRHHIVLRQGDKRPLAQVIADLDVKYLQVCNLEVRYQNRSRRSFSCLTGESRSVDK